MLLYVSEQFKFTRQRRRVLRMDYNVENLRKAVEAVNAGVMSSRQAAIAFGVPRSTVYLAAVKAKTFEKF